jgi:hypothetical protein
VNFPEREGLVAKDQLSVEEMTKERSLELWELNIGELAGHNIETEGRTKVNEMLQSGWILLHIYTLKYKEDGAWRDRPMAILGKPKKGADI